MRKLMVVGMMVLGLSAAPVRAGGLICAVDAALQGTLGTAIEWQGHAFKIGPVEMVDKVKGKHVLTGSLVYRNGQKKDETIEYRVTKHGSAVKNIELQINGGMWIGLSPEMSKALGDYRNGDVEEKKKDEIHRALYKAGEGSWQRTAELIVAFIGIRHC